MFCLASEISSEIFSRWKTSTFTSFKSSDCKSDLSDSHAMICMDMVDVFSITPEDSSAFLCWVADICREHLQLVKRTLPMS